MNPSAIFPWMLIPGEPSDPLTSEELAKLRQTELKRGFPLPDDEERRIRTLREAFALECSKEALIDRYLRILRRVMRKFPIHCISFVDIDRTWIISFDAPRHLDFFGIERWTSFCDFMVNEKASQRGLYVPNASVDERFCRLPWVNNAMSTQFYAGASISVDGMTLGAIAVVDRVPRLDFNKQDAEDLQYVSDILSSVLSSRRQRYLLLLQEQERIRKMVADTIKSNVQRAMLHAAEIRSLVNSVSPDHYHEIGWSSAVEEKLSTLKESIKELENSIHDAVVKLTSELITT